LSVSRKFFAVVCLGLLLICAAGPRTALAQQDDARMNVLLPNDPDTQGSPDVSALLGKAMPILWDRIVPVAERRKADALGNDSRMVARVVPGHDSTLVEFRPDRVFAALRDAQIPAIITPPSFHLLLNVHNNNGQEMQQTTQLLNEEAASFSPPNGIELAPNGIGMVLDWHWLDSVHVELSVRGQSKLGEFTETHTITDADSLPALKAWLDDVLLRARDAYAYQAQLTDSTASNGPGMQMPAKAFTVELRIERNNSLLAQVALEDALSRDPRVHQLLPESLSGNVQQYELQLEGSDTSWLGDWFARRGYRVNRLADGSWAAQ